DGETPLLAEELAQWALPQLSTVIEEGRLLFEFVDAHAHLEAIGLLPAYLNEGYLVIPQENGPLLVLQYTVSALTGNDGRYRTLRTRSVDAELAPLMPPSAWKEALADVDPDLPTPAAYHLDVDMFFPMQETLLPIAKRKLLRMLSTWGEA
ncbi:MAG: hypothetical protein R3284_04920, partial [Rubricoccaceae bacterium]|nr:hypothetical protein [Rubricoccaceae bacterium]